MAEFRSLHHHVAKPEGIASAPGIDRHAVDRILVHPIKSKDRVVTAGLEVLSFGRVVDVTVLDHLVFGAEVEIVCPVVWSGVVCTVVVDLTVIDEDVIGTVGGKETVLVLISTSTLRELRRIRLDGDTAPDAWLDIEVDMAEYSGRRVNVELLSAGPTLWHKVELGDENLRR